MENKMHNNKPNEITILDSIEPHKIILNIPCDGSLLYKTMTSENLVRSIVDSYALTGWVAIETSHVQMSTTRDNYPKVNKGMYKQDLKNT